jgi:DNA-binding winged helix-turn-helix (wHTH) protein
VETPPESAFHLGDKRIEPARCAILTEEGEIRVEPRVMDVLVLMVARAGQVVTREEFIKTIWNGTFVTDEVLSRCIYRLRQALGDNSRKPRFIETVSKKGYRLIAPVRTTGAPAQSLPEPGDRLRESVNQQDSIPVAKRRLLPPSASLWPYICSTLQVPHRRRIRSPGKSETPSPYCRS